MQFSPEEIEKLKTMMLFLIRRKSNESAGHCGFHLKELEPILQQLVDEGKVELRPTINNNKYFLPNGNSR
ncbi:hypothetical protein [Leeuwenhoekiella nanhaiensis]|uniref:Uncharacterized protein n=1 Tax=Leeuwenhoekiella nanhaiensis TaxID=1655491 RepID=A0A2G1VM88_9FLAO|nr:hypothetical protein [Leeuwenhoekiella nanhaiensis]PHQ27873.1 hypothetical protein CJ305_17870 [Leeuwenhoekiella nanhaiensis]